MRYYVIFFFFFFQAEDGIRDLYVTGVQTCALPISVQASVHASVLSMSPSSHCSVGATTPSPQVASAHALVHSSLSLTLPRSEERRVGKECRCRWWGD